MLADAKGLAKEAYALARARGSTAVPLRLQNAARHTTGIARVAIVGERKRGKSTLVNALIEHAGLLPRDVDVATNCYIEVISPRRLGLPAEAGVRVHLQSGTVVEAGIEDIGRWGSEQANPGNARGVAYVQVLLPHPLLDAGLVLLDTPGVGGLRSAHGAMTLNALDQSDALVLLLGAGAPASADELGFLEQALDRVRHAILVESAGPEATDPLAVLEADREALRGRGGRLARLPILVASPIDAHDALGERAPSVAEDLRALSGIDDVAEHLLRGVLEPSLHAQAQVLAGEVLSCLDELTGPDRELLAAAGDVDRRTAAARAQATLDAADRASPVTAFNSRFAEVRRDADVAMQARVARDRDELLDKVEDRWSERVGQALPELCRSLLADAATEASRRITAEAGPIAADVARSHGLGEVAAEGEVSHTELEVALPERPKATRQLDQERMLGWLTRGGPVLMMGFVTANPVLVGVGVVLVAAGEQMQGASLNRRRGRDYVQRVVARGQLELRPLLDERASAVRAAYADDLHARHQARVERLRRTVALLGSDADLDGARARVEEVHALQARLQSIVDPPG